jgi:glycosyltransferase involved in cell wall biosynthesis
MEIKSNNAIKNKNIKKNKLVSIILPVYNGSKYLEKSIKSCLNQTYSQLELIIIDDASTDNTPAIIGDYILKDKRIISKRHTANRMLPGALNTGFSLAQGDYLTWTSDDNIYRPQALAEMVSFLEKNPSVDIVYAGMILINEQDRIHGMTKLTVPESIAYFNCVGGCFLYRRRVQEEIKYYDERLAGAEDLDFFQRAAAYFKLKPLYKNLYFYRTHNASLSATRRKSIRAAGKVARAKNLPKLQWISKNYLSEGHLRLAYLSILEKDMKTFWEAFSLAIRLAPSWVIRRFIEIIKLSINQKQYGDLFGSVNQDIKQVFLQ